MAGVPGGWVGEEGHSLGAIVGRHQAAGGPGDASRVTWKRLVPLLSCSRRLTPGPSPACPAGRYGAACSLECSCHNRGACEPTSGACRCGPGFYGQACEHREL